MNDHQNYVDRWLKNPEVKAVLHRRPGLFHRLTPEQREQALSYRGPEEISSPEMKTGGDDE